MPLSLPRRLAFAATLLLPLAALGAEIEVESRIEAVTVQLDRARVERGAVVTLEPGRHALVFPDLPVGLDRSSVWLTAADGAIAIGRPVFREVESLDPVTPAALALTRELERLEQQRRIERDTVAVHTLVLDVLRQSQLVMEPGGQNGEPGSLFTLVETRGKAALMAIRVAEQAIQRLAAEIDQKRRQLARLGQDPMRQLTLTVPVDATAAGEVALTLAYTVEGASFTPSVEARLDVGARVVTLTAMAEVSQRTGEDWRDVRLALSTAAPSWRTAAPETHTWYIDVRRDEPRAEAMLRSAPAMPMAMADSAAVAIDRAAFDVTYRLSQPETIAADGATQRVTIETALLPVELLWRTVPHADPAAYLTATTTYTGLAPLLPGQVQLQRDGQAIGETWLAGLQPDQELELGFGADPTIEVERRLVTDERAQTGLIGTSRRHERRFVIEATNRRATPVDLEILDLLPVSRDTRITVELLPATTTPTTTEHDRDAGVLAWQRRLEPGQTTEVTFAYAVRHPADLDVTGF